MQTNQRKLSPDSIINTALQVNAFPLRFVEAKHTCAGADLKCQEYASIVLHQGCKRKDAAHKPLVPCL